MKKLPLLTAVLFTSLFTSSLALCAPYVAGEQISPMALQDQHDKQVAVDEQTKVVLFSRSMKGGDIIKDSLTPLTGDKFPKDLVYVADISAMPSLIAKFVALPQMKDLPFAIGLDREGQVSQAMPDSKDMATMLLLDNLKIQSIAFFDSSDALSQALAKMASETK